MHYSKTVLITGANRGIGLALSALFTEKGYRVIMSGRNIQKLDQAKAEIESQQTLTLELDISSGDDIMSAAEKMGKTFGSLDILINNAAVLPGSANTLSESEQTLKETFETNVFGSWRTIKAFYPLLKRSADPRIINISSGMGSLSNMGSSYLAYRLSKVALNGLTTIVQADLGPGFKVISCCPGWVKTDMGGAGATRDPGKAAEEIFWLADSSEVIGGKFYRNKKIINW